MERQIIAYAVLALLIVGVTAVVVLSRRFAHYQRAVKFGRNDAKPVWKPF